MELDYAQVCEQVARAVAKGDLDALATEVRWVAEANGHRWEGAAADVLELLREMPAVDRAALVVTLERQYREYPALSVHRGAVPALPGLVAEGLPAQILAAARVEALEACARQYAPSPTWLAVLVTEAAAAGRPPSPAVVGAVRRALLARHWNHETLKPIAAALTEPAVNPGEAWADAALAEAAGLAAPWTELLRHAATAASAKPSAAWDQRGRAILGRLDEGGQDAAGARILGWLALVGRPRTAPLEPGVHGAGVNELYDPYNANAVRGLTWLLALLPAHPDAARTLGALVETSLRKVAGTGPRNPKVANAAVAVLARTDHESALAELARLASRVTFKGTLKPIEAALDARAAALGLSREEVEELAVPSYGLTEVGRLPHPHGELAVVGAKAVLRWRNAAGRDVKSPSADVRRDHPEQVAALKTSAKDIDRMLGAQSERLDRQFLARRGWTYTAWRARLLDHPLLGTLARRLLWTVDGAACGFADGGLRTLAGDPLPAPAGDAPVALWHPVGREPAEVVAWRDWLERYGITQPFKQAHREVYLLTDAERATGTYSNRFAAHVLRQHQFHSLAAVRGWRNKLRLMVDDTYEPAVRELPRWGLRAEFWIEGAGDDYGADTTGSGSFLRLATDQVRFYPLDAPRNHAHACGGGYEQWRHGGAERVDPLPLAEVPPMVLSEVLRDVDLFVGVASVGNDPTWQDGGPDGRFRAYWRSYGFGELAESARSRKELLERIVPRLAIADRATVEGRFLHVRGERHTYRIHLGSGNVLMAPSDRYLCIVPSGAARGADGVGYLPFEGDGMLAVILSKAMMLARDTEITDPTVLSQL
ncbi:DUF4132 domain-containing protein [Streptomyces sp. V4-01]|uniref:DUF4132 domain-containing protein n=1 Tax=Actinacidiphila polyblastidii TaxID=3110430 RepID=A0ABU7P7D5_9ACTN|nr:DUF4132 domain-containing protein [Streptomyces sp. V4-01]